MVWHFAAQYDDEVQGTQGQVWWASGAPSQSQSTVPLLAVLDEQVPAPGQLQLTWVTPPYPPRQAWEAVHN